MASSIRRRAGLAPAALLIFQGLSVSSERAAHACEPPMPNVVRLNPFVTQGSAVLPAKNRPVMPRNIDFRFDVLHAYQVDVSSFRLRPDYPLKTEKEHPLAAEAHAEHVQVTVRSPQPLRPSVGYSVYGIVAGKRQRVFQFQTTASEDHAPPTAVQITNPLALGRFKPASGLCDDGHSRLLLSVAASDDSAREDQLRYLVEGAGEPQLLTSWCRMIEIRLDSPPPAPLRVHALDLAGNHGPVTPVPVPAVSPGSWDALRSARECQPSR